MKSFHNNYITQQRYKIPVKARKVIVSYLNALQNNHIPVNQMMLFGSYAQENYKEWSDIDIALVSDIFEGKRFEDRGKIRKINLSVSSDLEVLPYRHEDFTPDDPFVREIMETGLRII